MASMLSAVARVRPIEAASPAHLHGGGAPDAWTLAAVATSAALCASLGLEAAARAWSRRGNNRARPLAAKAGAGDAAP